jgi:hypothetical protein
MVDWLQVNLGVPGMGSNIKDTQLFPEANQNRNFPALFYRKTRLAAGSSTFMEKGYTRWQRQTIRIVSSPRAPSGIAHFLQRGSQTPRKYPKL